MNWIADVLMRFGAWLLSCLFSDDDWNGPDGFA